MLNGLIVLVCVSVVESERGGMREGEGEGKSQGE